ncbi:hypothetical protein V1283_005327 [Bradyrhizobium sp. AZCC 2262]|uniref:hypothetical protein n=1 Tax=Bradyrhizobium sp. AZCC 2262 TaxID=3117022 RepID=UPI002FEF5F7C
MRGEAGWAVGLSVAFLLGGCGLYTPLKSEIRSDVPVPAQNGRSSYTEQGRYENQIVVHVMCELAYGLLAARRAFSDLHWLDDWGTAVTLTITAQDQGAINPGVSFTPSQTFSIGLSASAAATATRTETIQYTYLNADLINSASEKECGDEFGRGPQIEGDLKIREFLFDKALIARTGNTSQYSKLSGGFNKGKFKRPDLPWQWPVYNTFTEQITFLATYGGNVNPTWKLARFTGNTTPFLIGAQRNYTNDLIITLGPVRPPTEYSAAALDNSAQAQHNARVSASAIATSLGR